LHRGRFEHGGCAPLREFDAQRIDRSALAGVPRTRAGQGLRAKAGDGRS
jgi:hypothetical protein